MDIEWQFDQSDVQRVRKFIAKHASNPFVQERIRRNLAVVPPNVSRERFWHVLVACLLTTQQQSGPTSKVAQFIRTEPFLLSYEACRGAKDVLTYTAKILGDFGGIRFTTKISGQVAGNLSRLETGLWARTQEEVRRLREARTPQAEKSAAGFVDDNFKGFGPKQSRNLLQMLGLTRYEIPIDSRIAKWLNKFGFPFRVSAEVLARSNDYEIVSDGVKALCQKAGVFPTMLDAAVFASFDGNGWNPENVIW